MSHVELPLPDAEFALSHMARALELAARGRGLVEPNPMVGCVIVNPHGQVVGEGFHTRYGAAHAEVEALAIAGPRARGGTLFVTLEPCRHQGKTPPCTQAIIAAGISRVVAAMRDPFPQVAGGGFAELKAAGIEVHQGLLEAEAVVLNAPYLKLLASGRSWIVAKWAMTLDGKLASSTGDSRWISSAASRAVVHRLRGRMDAILVGIGTARADDPLLTARPAGARIATRIVLDTHASLSSTSQLARTAREVPTLVAVGSQAPAADRDRLTSAGCEVWTCSGETSAERLTSLLDELGRRRMTNVLVEGGSQVFGTLFDLQAIDELHAFIAPKLIGGASAPPPLAGIGLPNLATAATLLSPEIQTLPPDLYLSGRVQYHPSE